MFKEIGWTNTFFDTYGDQRKEELELSKEEIEKNISLIKSKKYGFKYYTPSFQQETFDDLAKSSILYIKELELKNQQLTRDLIYLEDEIEQKNNEISFIKSGLEKTKNLYIITNKKLLILMGTFVPLRNENLELKDLTRSLTDKNEELFKVLKKEIQNSKDDELCQCKSKCPICFTEKKDTALVPCGHLFCGNCSHKVMINTKGCPICKEKIQQCMKIYF